MIRRVKWLKINKIGNLAINSPCPLDTALVLTSDNFHLIFSPSLPPFLSRNPLVELFKNITACSHTFILF